MSRQESIVVAGAREHNLKDVTVELPRDSLVVITGLSGSGKSSLAFDTIYAEGQRRYVESLSAYARQFLGQMDKPDVDSIEGLSPAISIDQKTTSRNPRSTVGTVTEIYDYLRLLFARIGHPHCPKCGREIERQTVSQIVDQVLAQPEGTRLLILGPLIKDRKTEGDRVFEGARKQGIHTARLHGSHGLFSLRSLAGSPGRLLRTRSLESGICKSEARRAEKKAPHPQLLSYKERGVYDADPGRATQPSPARGARHQALLQ